MIYEEFGETPGTKRTIAEGGLPKLDGTPEQNEQAEEIRTRLLVQSDEILSRLRSDQIMTEAQKDTAVISPRQVTSEQVHSAEVALNKLRNQTDAAWWLAQSDASASTLLADLMNAAVNHPPPG